MTSHYEPLIYVTNGKLKTTYTLSFDVKRIRLPGWGILAAILGLWIPFTLIVLFGWSEFKRHYCLTILVGQLVSLSNTLHRSILLLYGIDNEGKIESYSIPISIMFVVGIFWQCLIVMRKVQQNYPTISYLQWHIFMVLPDPFLTSYAMALSCKFAVVMHEALH